MYGIWDRVYIYVSVLFVCLFSLVRVELAKVFFLVKKGAEGWRLSEKDRKRKGRQK